MGVNLPAGQPVASHWKLDRQTPPWKDCEHAMFLQQIVAWKSVYITFPFSSSLIPPDITSQETIILSRYPAEQNSDELGLCEEHSLISNSLFFFLMSVKALLSNFLKPQYSYLWKVDSMNIYFQVFVWIKRAFLGKLPWRLAVLIIHSKKKCIINYCNNG